MMKKILLSFSFFLVLFFIPQSHVFAFGNGYTISGKVTTDSGAFAYPDLVVSLNTGQTATTDTSGNYTFSNLPEGAYVLTLNLPDGNFVTTSNPVNVNISADTTENFEVSTINISQDFVNPNNLTLFSVSNVQYDPSSLTFSFDFTAPTGTNVSGAYFGILSAPEDFHYYLDDSFPECTFDSSTLTGHCTSTSLEQSSPTYEYYPGESMYINLIANQREFMSQNVNPTIIGAVPVSEAAPATSITLSPSSNPDGTYPDPTTFTLSATAFGGYSVDSSYYSIDDGSFQFYSHKPTAIHTVSGDGNHTIKYFSFDSNGVIESIKTKTFNIAQNIPSPTPTPVTAINAGGSTAGGFAADTDFSNGSTFTTNATVDTSGVTNPAPAAVYQSVRYGNFSYTIPGLTANGTYTLQLHFSEPYFGTSQAGGGGVGSRIFNVSVNGTQELSNFDVYQAAGGANKAVMEQIPATADSNGDITVTFSNVVDNAMVSGIAVYDGKLLSVTPSPTPTPVSSLAIGAGGAGSGSYVADTDYTGGTTYSTNSSIDTSGVTNPAPQDVYQHVRYGNTFSYAIPTNSSNTNYSVRLDFSEPYFNTANSREFNVSINGTQVLNNFDVYQEAGGQNKAVSETFNTTSDSNGLIHINFTSSVDNAMVSGISISQ